MCACKHTVPADQLFGITKSVKLFRCESFTEEAMTTAVLLLTDLQHHFSHVDSLHN